MSSKYFPDWSGDATTREKRRSINIADVALSGLPVSKSADDEGVIRVWVSRGDGPDIVFDPRDMAFEDAVDSLRSRISVLRVMEG